MWRGVAILVLMLAGQACAGDQPPSTSPAPAAQITEVRIDRAARITTMDLVNGVRIHYRRVPGAASVCLSITLNTAGLGDGDRARALTLAAVAMLKPRMPLGARVLSPGPEGIRLEYAGPRGPLERGLPLITDFFARPEVDPAALPAWKTAMLARLAEPASDPAGVAARALTRLMGEATPIGSRVTSPAEVDRLTADEVLAWQARLWAEGAIEVGIAADLAPDDLLGPIVEALVRIPPRQPGAWEMIRAARLRSEQPPPASKRTVQLSADIPAGDAVVLVAYGAPPAKQLDEYRAMHVARAILAQRLPARLGAAGLTLQDDGPSVALWPARGSSRGMLLIGLRVHGDADAGVVASAVIDRTLREICAPADGPGTLTEAEAKTHAETIAEEARRFHADARYWSRVLSTMDAQGYDPADLARAVTAYESITARSVASALERWADPAGRWTVILEPANQPVKPPAMGGP